MLAAAAPLVLAEALDEDAAPTTVLPDEGLLAEPRLALGMKVAVPPGMYACKRWS